MDELRDRKSHKIQQAIEIMEGIKRFGFTRASEASAFEIALIALREKLERENSPKPEALTLEEMSHMHGEPVFIVEFGTFSGKEWNILDDDVPVDFDLQDVNFKNGDCYASYNYGKTWLAYTTRPETEGD